MKITIIIQLAALALLLNCRTLIAQPSAFTYQGRLNQAGNPADALYEMQFSLYDAATNGNLVGVPVTVAPVTVTNGLFTVTLEFGANAFNGAARWLEVTVNLYGSDMIPTILSPRQGITSAPYAVRAANATAYAGPISDAQLSASIARLNSNQTFSGVNILTNALNAFVGNFSGNGTNLILPNGLPWLLSNQTFFGVNILTNPLNAFAGRFSGSGTNLTLPSGLPWLSSNQTFLGVNTLTNPFNTFAGAFSGSGTNLTLPSGLPWLSSNQTFLGVNTLTNPLNALAGSGVGLTALNASTLATGTVADGRLSTNVPLLNAPNNTFDGSILVTNILYTGGVGNNSLTPVAPAGSTISAGTGYPRAGIVVGSTNGYGVPESAGWGRAIYFHGGPMLGVAQTGDNSDPEFIARFNVASDSSQLRLGIGDDADSQDKFVVGITPAGTWVPRFSVDGVGNTVAAGAIVANASPDIAETIPAAAEVEPGDVVCADPQQPERAIRCGKGDRGLLGVISDGLGGFLINAHGHSAEAPPSGKPLVLAGRVPVKISLQNGPVQIGDYLAPSSTRGVAMRATEPGPVVGIALAPFTGGSGGETGKVLCFVKVGEANIAAAFQQLASQNDRLEKASAEFVKEIAELKLQVEKLMRNGPVNP